MGFVVDNFDTAGGVVACYNFGNWPRLVQLRFVFTLELLLLPFDSFCSCSLASYHPVMRHIPL